MNMFKMLALAAVMSVATAGASFAQATMTPEECTALMTKSDKNADGSLAMDEAKIKREDFKSAVDQVHDIVRKLQPVLPIKFEHATLEIIIPSQYAPKVYGVLASWGTVKRQEWLADGSWAGELDVPAGMVMELIDTLNSKNARWRSSHQHNKIVVSHLKKI